MHDICHVQYIYISGRLKAIGMYILVLFFGILQVPERVRAMNASIKLLLIVREPVTRAISDYTQLRSHAATAILPLAESNAPGSGYGAKMPPTTTSLYAKLQAAHGPYDNALGSGAGAKETKLRATAAKRRAAPSAAVTTMSTPTTTPSAAQLAAK